MLQHTYAAVPLVLSMRIAAASPLNANRCRHLFVPPVAIRPSVQMDAGAGSNEDDLTVKLQVRHTVMHDA